MRKINVFMCLIFLLTMVSCGLDGPVVWRDPYPAEDKNTVWIYENKNIQIYFIPKVYKAYIYRCGELKVIKWNFGSGQSVTAREEDTSEYYYRGVYRATEDKFWLLNDYGEIKNNLFTEEEMEAEPTFYRYDMDDLPEDTPQEVLDYIAELGEEESIDAGEESTVEDETSPTEE